MHINVRFTKVKTTKNEYNLEAKDFSRIFYIGKTIILVLPSCVLVGKMKISLEVVYASRKGSILLLCGSEVIYILDFTKKTILKVTGFKIVCKAEYDGGVLGVLDEENVLRKYEVHERQVQEGKVEKALNEKDVMDTPLGKIVISPKKISLGECEVENELSCGEDGSTPVYYCSTFGGFILMASSNNSTVYFYDKDLKMIDIEGRDFVYVQADEEDNQLYIRGMDYSQGCLAVVDLKGNVTEYKISGIEVEKEEELSKGPFKTRRVEIGGEVEECTLNEIDQGDESIIDDTTKSILDKEIKTGIPRPTLSFISNESLSLAKDDTVYISNTPGDGSSKDIFSTLKKEDSYKTNIFNQKKIERSLDISHVESNSSVNSSSLQIEEESSKDVDTIPKSSFSKLSTLQSKLKEESTKEVKSPFESFSKTIQNTLNEGNSSFQSTAKDTPKDTKSPFESFSKTIQNTLNEDAKSPFSKLSTLQSKLKEESSSFQNDTPKEDTSSSFKNDTLKNDTTKYTTPTSSTNTPHDNVQKVILDILSIKVNRVPVNHYKSNSTTDKVEKELHKAMSTLRRVDDLKREMESSLLCMINTLDISREISLEESLRYFDEVIERKSRIKTPLVYNTPLVVPSLRKMPGVEIPLKDKNVLTKINLEPVYLLERMHIGYKKGSEGSVGRKDGNVDTKKGDIMKEDVFKAPTNTPPVVNTLPPNPTTTSTPPTTLPTTPLPPSIPTQLNSSDIFNRVLVGSTIPLIKKEENNPQDESKPPSAFSRFASSHNLFK